MVFYFMENIDIVKHFSEIYKIDFTDKEAESLGKFFTESDIGNVPYTIRPISQIETFMNQVKLVSTISDDMDSFHLEEMVYAKTPFIPPTVVEYESKLHKSISEISGTNFDKDTKNFVIIRQTNYDVQKKSFVHDYFIYVYNPELEVVAGGIILEDI